MMGGNVTANAEGAADAVIGGNVTENPDAAAEAVTGGSVMENADGAETAVMGGNDIANADGAADAAIGGNVISKADGAALAEISGNVMAKPSALPKDGAISTAVAVTHRAIMDASKYPSGPANQNPAEYLVRFRPRGSAAWTCHYPAMGQHQKRQTLRSQRR